MTELEGEVNDLEIRSIIGFDGAIIRGLHVHPDGVHVVYPLGNKVTVLNWDTKKQDFLSGHTNIISAVDLSRSGKFIASGQINHIGFKAFVIIWDFATLSIHCTHELHKVRIESLNFSTDEKYLMSLGGRDCGNIVVWNVAEKRLLSGGAASRGSKGDGTTLKTCNRRGPCFITGGDGILIIWSVDVDAKSISGIDVNMSKLKRVIYCMDMNERDEICYCGTSTGDVLKIRLNFHHDAELLIPLKPPLMQGCFAKRNTEKMAREKIVLYRQGVRSLLLLSTGYLLIGAGDGTVDLVMETKPRKKAEAKLKAPSEPGLHVLKSTNVKGSVTSLQIFRETTILAGTANCEIFSIDLETFEAELLITCHNSIIYYLAFPHQFSNAFATAGKDDVRIWNMETLQELLRIKVPNFSCSAIEFAHDGKSILTAWSDGVIRAFTPLTGRLMYAILNSHNKGASALAITHHGGLLVSGGCEGQVRLWEITPCRQQLIVTLKEHNGPVQQIHINGTDDEAVSASSDGSCIIWDLIRQCRKQILFANTLFMCVRYYPTGVQLLTGGTSRKIGYWEVLDGSLVREIEGSPSGAINSLDITADGDIFATGGNDQIIKLWKYQEGVATHIGIGHSAVITALRFSPSGEFIVSASGAGSIFVWRNPYFKKGSEVSLPRTPDEENIADLPSVRSSSGDSHSTGCCCCRCNKVE